MNWEWKLRLDDIDAFGNELTRFAREYVPHNPEEGLLEVEIGEWSKSLFDVRPIDRVGEAVNSKQGRTWGISFIRQEEGKPSKDLAINVSVSRIGGNYPLLLSIRGYQGVMPPLIRAFVERAKQLWDASPVVLKPLWLATFAKSGPTSGQFEFLLPLPSLIAASKRSLEPVVPGWIKTEWKKQESDNGELTICMLKKDGLGSLALLEFNYVTLDSSMLTIKPLFYVTIADEEEILHFILGEGSEQEKRVAESALMQKKLRQHVSQNGPDPILLNGLDISAEEYIGIITEGRDKLRTQKRTHLKRLMKRYFMKMSNDVVWNAYERGHKAEHIQQWLDLRKPIPNARIDEQVQLTKKPKPPGRPRGVGLSIEERIKRVAYAMWAEEIRAESESAGDRLYWKEIAKMIGWPRGSNKAGVKLLEDARNRLSRLQDHDPDTILPEAKKEFMRLKTEKEKKKK
jgi:hypothetical protein